MYAEGITPIHIITAHTMAFPFRASQAARPHRHPRVVPMPRMINVVIELPIDTSVIKTNCSAAHTSTGINVSGLFTACALEDQDYNTYIPYSRNTMYSKKL